MYYNITIGKTIIENRSAPFISKHFIHSYLINGKPIDTPR